MISNEIKITPIKVLKMCLEAYGVLFKYNMFSGIYKTINIFISGLTAVITGLIIKKLIDSTVTLIQNPDGMYTDIIFYTVLLVFAMVFLKINNILMEIIRQRISYVQHAHYTSSFLEKINDIDALAFKNNDYIANMTYSGANHNKYNLLNYVENMLISICAFVGTIVLISSIDIRITIVTCAISILNIILSYKNIVKNEKLRVDENKDWRHISHYQSLLREKRSVKELKTYKSFRFFAARIKAIEKALMQKINFRMRKRERLDFIFNSLIDILKSLLLITLIYNFYNGKNTVGDFAIYATITMSLSQIFGLSNTFSKFLSQYYPLAKSKIFLSDNKWFEVKPETMAALENDIYEIRLENVSFRYNENSDFVLKNINLTISAKEYIALVGLNGAGKTTLIKLLSGIYRPTDGIIYYNGIPHTELEMSDIRNKCSIVYQNYCKYAVSAMQNIKFGHEMDEGRIVELAGKLDLLGTIENLPKKWDTYLRSEVGDTLASDLSMGQWQKISILRAIMKPSSVFIMDEPTSSLDIETENLLYNVVNEEIQSNIKIIISHQMSCIQSINKIVVLDNGNIAEIGNHRELIEKQGIYCQMFNNQAQKYI